MMWKKIDMVENHPYYLDDDDDCYFARDFVSGGGYDIGEGNSLIFNFKKSISKRGKPEWRHKVLAIEQFATELSFAMPDNAFVTCIPSSMLRSNPEYDDRLDQVLTRLSSIKSGLTTGYPLERCTEGIPSHRGGHRDPERIYEELVWKGFSSPPAGIIVIDDVISSGAHYKACKKMILEHHSDMAVTGFFWARTINQETL